jgi:hypothetical protein
MGVVSHGSKLEPGALVEGSQTSQKSCWRRHNWQYLGFSTSPGILTAVDTMPNSNAAKVREKQRLREVEEDNPTHLCPRFVNWNPY